MMPHTRLSAAAAWITGVSLVAIANGGVAHAFTVFSDRRMWSEAVSAFTITMETFDAADTQLLQDGDSVILPTGIELEAKAPSSFAAGSITSGFDAFADGNTVLSDLDPDDALTFSFPQPIVGFGFDYLDVDLNGVQIVGLFSGGSVTDSVEVPIGNDARSPTADFFGILADTPLSTFTLQLASEDGVEVWNLDNLSVAVQEPAATIAEPTSVAALGLLMITGLSSRLLKRVRV